MLTTGGKDWLARNAGVGNCFASSGVSYKDLEGNWHTGSTTDVAAMLVVAGLLGYPYTTKEIVNGKSYADFKSANGGYDLDIEDVRTVYDLQETTPPYCAAGATPPPTVTPTPTPVPTEKCEWFSDRWPIMTADIMELVRAYVGEITLGWEVRVADIMGAVSYYLKQYESGNSLTGCSFS